MSLGNRTPARDSALRRRALERRAAEAPDRLASGAQPDIIQPPSQYTNTETDMLPVEAGTVAKSRRRFVFRILGASAIVLLIAAGIFFLLDRSKALATRMEVARQEFQAGRYTEAVIALDRVLSLNSRSVEAWDLKARALFSQQEVERAVEAYGKVIALDPSRDQTYLQRGIALMQLNAPDRAAMDFGVVIAHQPKSSEALRYRGEAFLKMRRYDEAIADLKKSAEIKPDPGTYYQLGQIAETKGDLQAALQFYTTAIETDERQPYFWAARSDLRRRLGDLAGAEADYREYQARWHI